MKTHKIGVIGYGVWGTHALQEDLARLDGVEIAAVHASPYWGANSYGEALMARAREYAAQKGCPLLEDWEAIATDPDIDILSVMTSPASKTEPVLLGLAHGKHIVTDKPLALNLPDAQQIVEAESASSGIGFVL